MKKIKIIVINPKEKPVIKIIEDKYEILSNLVKGNVEEVFYTNDISILINSNGRNLNLCPNRIVNNDILVGTLIFIGINETEDFFSLSDFQINDILTKFNQVIYYKSVITEKGYDYYPLN